jgi:hypothetical protein
MILYHTTTADRADSIMAGGFRDNATVNKRLTGSGTCPRLTMTCSTASGCLISMLKSSRSSPSPSRRFIVGRARVTWPGTQYWAKAAVWNQFPRSRLSLDDVIRLRLDPKGGVPIMEGFDLAC